MKREGEWEVKPLPIHGYQVVDDSGREIVCDAYRKEDAEQIVREHNAHRQLREVLQLIQGFNWQLDDSPHGQEIKRRALELIDQKGPAA